MPEQPGRNDDHTYGGLHTQQFPPEPASQGGSGGERFFGWLRSLGVVRQNGWIGGVCGGVAARLGIDPIIVRGIIVVVAVLGGPAFLLYAAAWLMLPDAQGDIHLQRVIKGHFDPPIVAITVMALFSFLPFAQGFWWAGAQLWGGLSWFSWVGRVLWTLIVIALIIGVIVWAARSGRVPPTSPYPGPPVTPPGFPSTSPMDAGGGAAHSAPASAAPASTPSAGTSTHETSGPDVTDAASAATASAAGGEGDLDDWRARQEAWKADYAAWAAQQEDARAIRRQRSAELREQAQALAAEAEEARRRRRSANPRTSAAYVFVALGLALVAGGTAAAVALVGAYSDYAFAIALAVATGVIGLAIVTAGILRRRSGFLTFVSILLILATLGAALPPAEQELMLLPRAAYRNAQHVSIYQPVGSLELDYDASGTHKADVVQGAGDVAVQLQKGVSARVVVVQHAAESSVHAMRFDDQGATHEVAPTSGPGLTHAYVFGRSTPTVDVRIDQLVGNVDIYYYPAALG